MDSILQVFYSVFSGALLSLAIPNEIYNLGCPFITIFALIPYYAALKNAKSYRQSILLGLLQTGTTHICSSFWLIHFQSYAVFTLGGSTFAEAGLGALFAIFYFLPYSEDKTNKLYDFSASAPFYRKSYFRPLYFALVYTAYEWTKSSGFLGYPWGTVSSAMFKWPILMQLAAITGTYGITFLIVLVNGLIYESFSAYQKVYPPEIQKRFFSERFNIIKTTVILLLITIIYGTISYYIPRTPIKKLTTIFVQQNQDPWETTTDSQTLLVSQKLVREKIEELKQEDKKPQLVVFSEGAVQRQFPKAYSHYERYPIDDPFIPFIREIHTPLMTGGAVRKQSKEDPDKVHYFNSALFFDEFGNFRGNYAKLHLVPFAEAIPYMDNKVIASIIKKMVGVTAGWAQGTQLTYFEVPCDYTSADYEPIKKVIDSTTDYNLYKSQQDEKPTVKIASPICFDDSFTDVIRPLYLNGAELFINMTDDSWSKTKSSEYQHFSIAAYRAIEYRTTLVRSTNSGYSVVLDAAGRVLADLPLFEEAAGAYDVPIYKRKLTTYARFGNWLPYFCILAVFAYIFYMKLNFKPTDYIPSERTIDSKSKEKSHKKSKKEILKAEKKERKQKKDKKIKKSDSKKSEKHSKDKKTKKHSKKSKK